MKAMKIYCNCSGQQTSLQYTSRENMQRVVRHRAKILRVYFSLGNVVMITNILVVSILAQSDLHNTQLLILYTI